MLNYPLKPISDIPQPTESSGNFWLWAGIVTVFLLLLEPEKKQRKPSPTPADLHGLEGRIRSCDAWFESTDKKGRLIHRCFIYKPTCNAKRCKADPKLNERISEMQGLSGYTSTCLKFGKNRFGHRQCKKFAQTCGSADEGCRYDPVPVPGHEGKRTQKDFEIEADALAQELAREKNFELDYNKNLMRDVLSYGGIAPHKSGFMSEEYREIPKKYKRADGIPMDELAQEMGIDESTLADRIYQAEASFQELKDMRGGAIARRFKKADFIDEAWNRMRSGRGFFGGLESLKHDVFRWKIGSKQIEVIKNPTDSEIRQISNEFHEKYPRSKESGIRSTYDQYDNKYVWGADDLHSDVEPMINMLFHVYTHQSPGMAKWLLDTGMTNKKKITLFGIKFNPDVTENQIRARVLLPKKIIKGTYFIRASTTPGVSYVMGQDRSGKVMTQSIRFDRDLFDNSSAKRWFNSNIKRIKERDRQGYVYPIPSISGGKKHSEDYFSPRQQEMFPKMRRELVLEPEETASIFTVDPLYVCLERQGWDLRKVRKYQENISAKMTPDMFGKLQRLTGAEVMLQEQIQKCLDRR